MTEGKTVIWSNILGTVIFGGGLMKKTFLVTFLALVITVGAMAQVIDVWLYGFTNEMAKVVSGMIDREFTPKTGIEVRVSPLSWEDGNKVFLALISGDAPDVLSAGTSGMLEYGLRGSVLDLRETFGEEYIALEAQLFDAITGPLKWMGTRFGVPQNISVMTAAYRLDLLSEMGLGIPNTWAELYTILPKIKAKNKEMAFDYGSPNYAPEWGIYSLVTQHGGQFYGEDGFTSAFDRPESIAGFKEYTELYTKHNLPRSGPGFEPFKRGEWLMTIDGYWLLSNLEVGAPELKGKWAPGLIPGTKRKDGSVNHGTFAASSAFGIPKTAKNPKASWEFIKWFCNEETQLRYVEEVMAQIKGFMQVPTAKKALANMSSLSPAVRETLYNQVHESYAVPYAPTSGVLLRFVQFAMHEVLMDKSTPEEAALKAASEMNKEMSRRKVEYQRFLDRLQQEGKKYTD